MTHTLTLENILNPVAFEMTRFRQAFRDIIHSDVRLIANVNQHILDQDGKFLRPALVILSAGAAGAIHAHTIESAALIEVLHTATLLHDDVVDQASLRRGAESVNFAWNNKIAVLMGDFFLSRALKTISRLDNKEMLDLLTQLTEDLITGEISQFNDSNGADDEKRYIETIKNKTATLIAASCKMGIISIDGSQELAEKMNQFGLNLGLAFQIKDDLLDLTGTSAETGKQAEPDFSQEIYTLPVIHTLKHLAGSDKSAFLDALKQGNQKIDYIYAILEKNGGFRYAAEKIRFYSEQAKNCLTDLPDTDFKQALIGITDFNINRNL